MLREERRQRQGDRGRERERVRGKVNEVCCILCLRKEREGRQYLTVPSSQVRHASDCDSTRVRLHVRLRLPTLSPAQFAAGRSISSESSRFWKLRTVLEFGPISFFHPDPAALCATAATLARSLSLSRLTFAGVSFRRRRRCRRRRHHHRHCLSRRPCCCASYRAITAN